MAIPKKAYLLSFFSRHYHKIMKLKCKARRYLSLFSCNCVSRMTNYVNFKLSKDVEKNPGPTQYNTDHHEVIITPFMQNHRSTMQLGSITSRCSGNERSAEIEPTMQLTSPISCSQDQVNLVYDH